MATSSILIRPCPAACCSPDHLLAFLLPKLDASGERTRVGTLQAVRHIINSAGECPHGAVPGLGRNLHFLGEKEHSNLFKNSQFSTLSNPKLSESCRISRVCPPADIRDTCLGSWVLLLDPGRAFTMCPGHWGPVGSSHAVAAAAPWVGQRGTLPGYLLGTGLLGVDAAFSAEWPSVCIVMGISPLGGGVCAAPVFD